MQHTQNSAHAASQHRINIMRCTSKVAGACTARLCCDLQPQALHSPLALHSPQPAARPDMACPLDDSASMEVDCDDSNSSSSSRTSVEHSSSYNFMFAAQGHPSTLWFESDVEKMIVHVCLEEYRLHCKAGPSSPRARDAIKIHLKQVANRAKVRAMNDPFMMPGVPHAVHHKPATQFAISERKEAQELDATGVSVVDSPISVTEDQVLQIVKQISLELAPTFHWLEIPLTRLSRRSHTPP